MGDDILNLSFSDIEEVAEPKRLTVSCSYHTDMDIDRSPPSYQCLDSVSSSDEDDVNVEISSSINVSKLAKNYPVSFSVHCNSTTCWIKSPDALESFKRLKRTGLFINSFPTYLGTDVFDSDDYCRIYVYSFYDNRYLRSGQQDIAENSVLMFSDIEILYVKQYHVSMETHLKDSFAKSSVIEKRICSTLDVLKRIQVSWVVEDDYVDNKLYMSNFKGTRFHKYQEWMKILNRELASVNKTSPSLFGPHIRSFILISVGCMNYHTKKGDGCELIHDEILITNWSAFLVRVKRNETGENQLQVLEVCNVKLSSNYINNSFFSKDAFVNIWKAAANVDGIFIINFSDNRIQNFFNTVFLPWSTLFYMYSYKLWNLGTVFDTENSINPSTKTFSSEIWTICPEKHVNSTPNGLNMYNCSVCNGLWVIYRLAGMNEFLFRGELNLPNITFDITEKKYFTRFMNGQLILPDNNIPIKFVTCRGKSYICSSGKHLVQYRDNVYSPIMWDKILPIYPSEQYTFSYCHTFYNDKYYVFPTEEDYNDIRFGLEQCMCHNDGK